MEIGDKETTKSQSKNIYALKFEEIFLFETPEGGAVILYKVINKNDDLPLDDFYIASFDDRATELAWGIGSTAREALDVAERRWNEGADERERKENPFTEAREDKHIKKYLKS